MIDLMGGSIMFQSAVGSGTSAKIKVPLSIDTEGDGSAEETVSNEVRVHLLGFESKDGLALAHMAASMKRQLRASRCDVVRSLAKADAVVIEEKCDLGPHKNELLAFTKVNKKQIVMFGASTSPHRTEPPSSIRLCDEEVPVCWVFRPLLPSVIDRIIAAIRSRSWDDGPTDQSPGHEKGQMLNPDTSTTESDSDADQQPKEEQHEAPVLEPALSDPNLADLKHTRPELTERSETSKSVVLSHAKETENLQAESTELQAAFKGPFLAMPCFQVKLLY